MVHSPIEESAVGYPPRPMAGTFSPVRPRVRWGIPSFVSAIRTFGFAVPNAAAPGGLHDERLLIAASIWFVGSN